MSFFGNVSWVRLVSWCPGRTLCCRTSQAGMTAFALTPGRFWGFICGPFREPEQGLRAGRTHSPRKEFLCPCPSVSQTDPLIGPLPVPPISGLVPQHPSLQARNPSILPHPLSSSPFDHQPVSCDLRLLNLPISPFFSPSSCKASTPITASRLVPMTSHAQGHRGVVSLFNLYI